MGSSSSTPAPLLELDTVQGKVYIPSCMSSFLSLPPPLLPSPPLPSLPITLFTLFTLFTLSSQSTKPSLTQPQHSPSSRTHSNPSSATHPSTHPATPHHLRVNTDGVRTHISS